MEYHIRVLWLLLILSFVSRSSSDDFNETYIPDMENDIDAYVEFLANMLWNEQRVWNEQVQAGRAHIHEEL
ncbi:hypothetical protein JTE90_018270 [Oedothorax gibbosus]|uniref:Uncharacterized protein n=1 Tax=Oedothorax gibbosus TaxID=931172 RepID=A0AAV6UXK8_9ARAC|nr:hypothetical protein JTE90_018270 [Oedothorax gibbosus]